MYEPPTVDEVRVDVRQFGTLDYIVFTGICLGSVILGIYYSFRGKKCGESVNEYLQGGRDMSIIPVGTSLIASCISGITLLMMPTEIYLHGTEYAFVFIPIFMSGLLSAYLLLPVFHDMKLTSCYEYLEKRFDRNVRLYGSLMFMVVQVFWLPFAMYIPTVSIKEVSGMSIEIVMPCVCLLCILYSILGGLKTIIWIECFQTWIIIASMILVCLKGSLDFGGFREVWKRNYEGGRLIFPSLEEDLTIRHSLWALSFGGLIMWMQWSALNQNVFQRYSSLSSLSQVRRALWIFVFGTTALILISCYAGLVIYAFYQDCDPLTTKLAKAEDQLLLLLVMRIFENLPGLPGLFVAGVISASLSSLSMGLNSMSAVVLEDFFKPFLPKSSSTRINLIMKGVVLFFGLLISLLLVNANKLGDILQFSLNLGSITSGPIFGIFFCGVFLPWVNAKGALLGGVLGLFASGFVVIGAQHAAAVNKVRFIPKPTSVEGCLYYYNATVLTLSLENTEGGAVFPLFKLSYFWYTAFGGFISITLALVISCITGFTELHDVDPIWFSPVIRCFFPVSNSLKRREKLLLKELKKCRI